MIHVSQTSEMHDDIDRKVSDILLISNPDVILRNQSDGSILLFELSSGRILKINPVGALIWQLLDGTRTAGQVINDVRKTFVDVPESIDQDVRQFIDHLFENGFAGKLIN